MSEIRIWELLERFRKNKFYMDVLWQDMRVQHLKPRLTEGIADLTRNELKELMLSRWFMRPRLEEIHIDRTLADNDFTELKLRLLNLFLGKGPINRRLQAVMDLRHVGPYIASQFLSAVDNQYIIFHEEVLEGIKALLPQDRLARIDLPGSVTTAEEYLRFNEVCKGLMDLFKFKSLGELHEFFWHGHSRSPEYGLGWF